jgi:hypothetical protein
LGACATQADVKPKKPSIAKESLFFMQKFYCS